MEEVCSSIEALRDVNSSMASIALKQGFKERSNRRCGCRVSKQKDTTMKLATIALASAFALSGTFALANTVHHKSDVRIHRDTTGMGRMYGPVYDSSPNGTADGPTTLSGTGSSQFGGSSPGISGYN
jgi:hypothetical protein